VNASDRTVVDFALPALDVRARAKGAVVPALLAALVVTAILLVGGPGRVFADAVGRALGADPASLSLGLRVSWISLAGYIGPLRLIAGHAVPRVGWRGSALISSRARRRCGCCRRPAPRRRGLVVGAATGRPRSACRHAKAAHVPGRPLLGLLASIALSGAALTFGLVRAGGPTLLSAIPAGRGPPLHRDRH
jgi:hypothetical protein